MKFPIKFKDVLPVADFISMQTDLAEWFFNNSSNSDDTEKFFFGQTHRDSKASYLRASTTVSLKIKRVLRENLRLIRIHSGGKLFGTCPTFHTDYNKEDHCYTFVLFTNTHWDTNWGGEFIAQDPFTKDYIYVPYIPNNGVLIPSHWQHTGSPPLTPKAGLRTSVAFMFTLHSHFKDFYEKNPINSFYA